jgi:hypothetical protein
MSDGGSFKKGSGSLDFGDSDEESQDDVETTSNETEAGNSRATSERDVSRSTEPESGESDEYPYFVRRSGVTDERSNRLEIHVRDEIADQEREYLNEVADELETGNVAKTDAREFALKLAFEHPEEVAELMEDEGYTALD